MAWAGLWGGLQPETSDMTRMIAEDEATGKEVDEAKQVVELFSSFGVIAEALRVAIDVTP